MAKSVVIVDGSSLIDNRPSAGFGLEPVMTSLGRCVLVW